jgi:hypothetical protein
MSYPVYTKEPSIWYPNHTKELDSLFQTVSTTSKRKKIKNQETTLLDNDEKFRAAKGITYAIIFCIPFWILIIKLFVWLI